MNVPPKYRKIILTERQLDVIDAALGSLIVDFTDGGDVPPTPYAKRLFARIATIRKAIDKARESAK